MTPSDLADDYLSGAARLRAAVAGMTRDQMAARPIAGKWSTLQVVAHVADFEVVYADRILRVLSHDHPALPAADDARFTAALFYDARDADEELAAVDAVRRKVARLIRRLSPDQLQRTGAHSERGPVTLEQVIRSATRHIPHHLPFIADKRQALGG